MQLASVEPQGWQQVARLQQQLVGVAVAPVLRQHADTHLAALLAWTFLDS